MNRLFFGFLLIVFASVLTAGTVYDLGAPLIGDTVVSTNPAFFVNSGQSLGGATGNGVALGDLNGNGYLDAFVANNYSSLGPEANQIWFNDGNGFFTAGPTLGDFDGYAVALGDLDGDGDLDAVVAGSEGNFVWINQGGAQGGQPGAFLPGAMLGAAGYGVAIGDVNGDGHLDVLIVGNSNQLWLNNGDATFTADFTFPFQFSRSVVLADLDGDGWLDAVIADSAFGANTQVWWNDGNWDPGPGSFSPGLLLPMENLANAVAVADLDNDGHLDVFLAGSGPNQVFWNEGERAFSTAGPLPLNDNSSAVALADVDGDGQVDAVVGNVHADPMRLWRNEGGRQFTVAQEFGNESGLYWSRGLGLGDLTGDGSPDLFEATTANDRVWFNAAAPPPIANEEGWQVQLVDTRGRAGLFPGLTLDAAGHPHVSYVQHRVGPDDTQSYDLIYAFWDGRRWQRQFVTRHDYMAGGLGDLATNTALALDSQGRPHIAFVAGDGPFAFADQVLKYAVWTGGAWQVETVDDSKGDIHPGVALAVDSQDRPHLSYARKEPSFYVARYAVRTMAGWQLEQVEAVNGGDVGLFNSLALDGNDQPHISYSDELDQWVRYARKTGGSWQIETAAGMGPFINRGFTSLALDGAEQPHIIFISDAERQLRYADWNGSDWQVQTVYESDPFATLAGQTSLALDGDDRPHIAFVERGDVESLRYARRDGAAWQLAVVDNKGQVGRYNSMALDGNGAPHVAYYDARFGDLRLAHWGPRWVHGPVDDTGVLLAPSLALADQTPAVGYYNQSSGQVKGALWNGAWEIAPVAFVNNEVTAVSLATSLAGRHMSYYDADNQHLVYAASGGGQWTSQVVDGGGDVGRYNRLFLARANSSTPDAYIAYWDATNRRVKLARLDHGAPPQLYTNTAGPVLNSDSGFLDINLLSLGRLAVSYYDGVNGDLRQATLDPGSGSWTDELIASDVGHIHALSTDATTAQPVVAFYDATSQAIRYTYRTDDGWIPPQTAVANVAPVTSLDLALGFESLDRPRLLFTTEENRLYLALKQDGIWQVELVVEADTSLDNARLALGDRPFLAYTQAGTLQVAHRAATLDVTSTAVPQRTGGAFNVLDACAALVNFFFDVPYNLVQSPAVSLQAAAQQTPLPEPALFAALHTTFAASPEGVFYINAYAQHGAEMGAIGLQDSALMWDAYGTLQNFLPGLEALVTGRGDQVVVTEEMVDDALDIWQRLAAVGSPELAETVNSELAKYNNLQDFVGLTFDEWAEAIGVNPPPVTSPCYDFNDTGVVDVADIQQVAEHWRKTSAHAEWSVAEPYDLDNDGAITIRDVMLVSAQWGESC